MIHVLSETDQSLHLPPPLQPLLYVEMRTGTLQANQNKNKHYSHFTF